MPKGKKITPLDLDELENSPTLNGMLAFREVPAGVSITQRSPTGLTPTGTEPPTSGRADIQNATPRESAGPRRQRLKETIDSPPVLLTPIGLAPIGSGPSLDDVLAELAGDTPHRSRGKLIRAERVEDGHSATQNTLYWQLWRTGREVKGSRSRFVQAGYGQLQAALGIDRSNVQDAIRELQKKLSIRILKPSTVGSATVYEVFSCEDILQRRREQGMLWVRKYGARTAEFVNPDETTIALPIGLTPTGAPPAGVSPGVGVTPTATIGVRPTAPIGVTPMHSVKEANQQSPSTSLVVEALLNELGTADDDAAKRIICRSRERAPDATDEEIAFHTRQQAHRLRNVRGLDNPIGVLITQVPKCFEGESFRRFRQTEQRRPISTLSDEPPAGQEAYEAILANPNASEDEKRIARIVLADKG